MPFQSLSIPGELDIYAASERHSVVSQKLLSQVGITIKSATGGPRLGLPAGEDQTSPPRRPGILDPSIPPSGESRPLISNLWDVQKNGIGRVEAAGVTVLVVSVSVVKPSGCLNTNRETQLCRYCYW